MVEKGIFPYVSKQESAINAGESFFQVQGRRGRGGGHGPSYRQDPSENWQFDILSEFEFLRSSFSLYYAILIYEREIYFSTM